MRKEMAELAQKAAEINKYRPETCCVIGEYNEDIVLTFLESFFFYFQFH